MMVKRLWEGCYYLTNPSPWITVKPRKRFPRFEAAGAPKLTLFHEDFLQWSTSERFDLVYSFGFIEHFNDWPGMIRRHAELVAEGGCLFLTTPYWCAGWRVGRSRVSPKRSTVA